MRASWTCLPLVLCSCLGAPAQSQEEPGPSYDACQLNGDWGCVGVECAADADAVQWIELVEAEIAERGWADRVFVVDAETLPDTDQVLVTLIQDVGWFRAWAPINGLHTDVSEAEFRADVSSFLDQTVVPTSVVSYAEIEDAVADCAPELEYDPCSDNFWGLTVRVAITYEPEPNCVEDVTVLDIDLATGEVVCDLDPVQVGCG